MQLLYPAQMGSQAVYPLEGLKLLVHKLLLGEGFGSQAASPLEGLKQRHKSPGPHR